MSKKELTYLDIIPEEIIGEIINIGNIVNVNTLKNLGYLSTHVKRAIDKYVRKLAIVNGYWIDIRVILVSFNSLDKIYTDFKLYIQNDMNAFIFKDGKYVDIKGDVYNPNMYFGITSLDEISNLEFINIRKINHRISGLPYLLRCINRHYVNFCLSIKFNDSKLTNFVRVIAKAGLMDDRMINSIMFLYVIENNTYRLLHRFLIDELILQHFSFYQEDLDLRRNRIADKSDIDDYFLIIRIGILFHVVEVNENTFDLFDMPGWNKENQAHLADVYSQTLHLLELGLLKYNRRSF